MKSLKTHVRALEEASDEKFRWHCDACDVNWCVNCKIPWHSGETCVDQKLKSKFQKNEREMMKLVKKGKLFKCSCNRIIEKSWGCKFMRCRCGRNFCWSCKKFLKRSHEDHECVSITESLKAALSMDVVQDILRTGAAFGEDLARAAYQAVLGWWYQR